jgi:lactoylglutathione lyase
MSMTPLHVNGAAPTASALADRRAALGLLAAAASTALPGLPAAAAPTPIPSRGPNVMNNLPQDHQLDRVHHIGVAVADLDRSLAFYRDLFGLEPLFLNDMRGEVVSRDLGIPNADLRFCMIKLQNVVLELIEWRNPEPASAPASGGPVVGAIHIAFEVPDIAALHARLSARGVAFVAAPHRFTEADAAPAVVGATFAYFRDPDGVGLEVYQKRSRHSDF